MFICKISCPKTNLHSRQLVCFFSFPSLLFCLLCFLLFYPGFSDKDFLCYFVFSSQKYKSVVSQSCSWYPLGWQFQLVMSSGASHPPCLFVLIPSKQGYGFQNPFEQPSTLVFWRNFSTSKSKFHSACHVWAAQVQWPVVKWESLPSWKLCSGPLLPWQGQLCSRLLLSNRFHPCCVSKDRQEG